MNHTHLILISLVGIVLVSSVIHWYKYQSSSIDSSSPPEYVKRLIEWAKKYQSVQSEDITHIQDADTIKSFFASLKKVPTCRSAKLLAHLYFSIYVERDATSLREFVSLMKEHYPDSYQWDNAFYWKHAEQLLWDTYDTLPSNDPKKDIHKIEYDIKTTKRRSNPDSNSTPNKIIRNFKAVVSKSKPKKEV
jgi:hypothetical protein